MNHTMGKHTHQDADEKPDGRRLRSDEGALLGLAPHDVSVMSHLLGHWPVGISAHGARYAQPQWDDLVWLSLRFREGIRAHVHLSWLDPHKVRRLTVVGERKMAVFDDMEPREKVRVFDSGAMWSLMKDGAYVIDPEPIGSEINATGKAVYGYNLRVDAEGTYTITFSFPNVLLTSGSHGTVPVCAEDELGAAVAPCSVSLDINVVTGGGGGGGKPH